MADIKIGLESIKVDGKRIGCNFLLDGDDVMVYAKSLLDHLPAELGNINNNTDIREDYVEEDFVRVEKDNPFYDECYHSAVYGKIKGLDKTITRLTKQISKANPYCKEYYQKNLADAYAEKEEYESIFNQLGTKRVSEMKSKKNSFKRLKENSGCLNDAFDELLDDGTIPLYGDDFDLSWDEMAEIDDYLQQVLREELDNYPDFPSAYEAFVDIVNSTIDDVGLFMSDITEDEIDFDFEINEEAGTYYVWGKVPTVLEKKFEEFRINTDLEMDRTSYINR